MASYLSSVLTSTTSRYNNLRKSLLSDENDGDTEDDSHISRVLRAYYVEKGRAFPSWLPPEPKSSRISISQYSQQMAHQTQQAAPRRGMGLSDLWDKPAQQAAPQAPQSLRRSEGSTLRVAQPQPQAARNESYSASNSSISSQRLTPSGGRPLPSQLEGSYQTMSSLRRSSTKDTDTGLPPPPTPGASAQDRLKARLWGGRSSSTGQIPGGSRDSLERGASNY